MSSALGWSAGGLSVATALEPRPNAPVYVIGSLGETLDTFHRLGYQAIDLLLRHPDDAIEADLERHLSDTRLALGCILTGLSAVEDGLVLSDPRTAALAVDRVRAYVDYAKKHHAKVVLGWMLGRLPAGEDRVSASALLIDSLQRCAEAASRADVELLLEPMNRYESNVITTASQALSLINRVGGGLGLLLDTFHMNIEEADPIQSVQDTMESIRHLHLADSNRAVPGTGHFPFSSLIRTLRDGGYGGSMGIETLPGPLALTDAAAAVDWYRQQTKVEAGRKG